MSDTRTTDNSVMPTPPRLSAALRRHELARRARVLARSPERATWPEVEELLSRELPLRAVLDVYVRAHHRGIRPGILWAWTRRHGAPLLALAVAAGLDEAELEHHLADARSLDRESLELHAELNGSPVVAVRTASGLTPWH
jgi:hypothetical protein